MVAKPLLKWHEDQSHIHLEPIKRLDGEHLSRLYVAL
jgi:hypothetical protein